MGRDNNKDCPHASSYDSMVSRLSTRQRGILARILSQPILANITFKEVKSLLVACGANKALINKSGSRRGFFLKVGAKTYQFFCHEPHPEKEMCKAAINDLQEVFKRIQFEQSSEKE